MHIHLVFFTFNSPPRSRTVSAKSCAAIWSSSKDKSKPIHVIGVLDICDVAVP